MVSGFGIKNEEDVKTFSKSKADGIVLGSAIIKEIQKKNDETKDKLEEAEEHLEVLEKAYDKYNVAELKAMLKEKGLPVGGKKADLIARLEEAQ